MWQLQSATLFYTRSPDKDMNEYIVKEGKQLRLGYTTGSCAAAAAKAAAIMLFSQCRKEQIALKTPKGITLHLEVHDIELSQTYVCCAIEKDGGDDPDITTGSYVYAKVFKKTQPGIVIDGGIGVGRVTKPGLDQPVGAAAINSVPRQMILENLLEVCRIFDYHQGLSVLISVPNGACLAQKTFNPRLGIVGGISILGTTGIVEPMSEQALLETIRLELRQRQENGIQYVLITPGNYGADYIQNSLLIDPKIAVTASNFIGDTIDFCKELGFRGVLLVGHIGKLVKIAGGMMNTHSKYGDCRMEIMSSHAGACGLCRKRIAEMMDCATCDDALRILTEENLFRPTLDHLANRIDFIMKHRAGESLQVGTILFSKEYGFLCQTASAPALLKLIREEYI